MERHVCNLPAFSAEASKEASSKRSPSGRTLKKTVTRRKNFPRACVSCDVCLIQGGGVCVVTVMAVRHPADRRCWFCAEEKAKYAKRDPIVAFKKYLIENGLADEAELKVCSRLF